ncbi:hypothetical protein T440DRAFT_319421 [Plenodomus tracheiphilus IPT5]|uniref:Post-SET domain-containing protein n=1 Tax=Plenodomus tracheiphilus IPT5 TaxID=1408161 RepID=A0A6A7BCZ8_9PLEO|nr:hypothetical protein T440DRAFT_319421 [Plenodomus tracheiphilus IPT5]
MQLSHPTLVDLRVCNTAAMDKKAALNLRYTPWIRHSLPPLTWSKAPPRPGVLQLVRPRALSVAQRQSFDHLRSLAWTSGSRRLLRLFPCRCGSQLCTGLLTGFVLRAFLEIHHPYGTWLKPSFEIQLYVAPWHQ